MAFAVGYQTTGKLRHISRLGIQLGIVLHHARVGRHIGEEYEWQTTLEETGTATELERLVAKDIPREAYTRTYGNAGVGPLAGIYVRTIIIYIIERLVTHDVSIVEEKTIDAKSVVELEVGGNVPLILQIDTCLVERDTCSRLLLTIVAVGKADDLRSSLRKEVFQRRIAIVARTIAHILVVGHLILIEEACRKLVLAPIVGHIVLDVGNGVMYGIVPGKELIAQCDVVLAFTVQDVDEWELARIAVTHVIQFREGGNEAVGKIVGETAVQLE